MKLLFLVILIPAVIYLFKIIVRDISYIIEQWEVLRYFDWPATSRMLIACGVVGLLLATIAHVILHYIIGMILS